MVHFFEEYPEVTIDPVSFTFTSTVVAGVEPHRIETLAESTTIEMMP